jgi:hypothetical protein
LTQMAVMPHGAAMTGLIRICICPEIMS